MRATGAASPVQPVLRGASGPPHAFAAFVSREAGVLARSGRDARALYVHGTVADLLVGTDRARSGGRRVAR
jgi:hypothetical protein